MARRVLLCGVATLLLAAPAGAGTIDVTLGVAPGRLALHAPPTVVTAGGVATILVRVADGRGSGAGWTLRVRSGSAVDVVAITAACAKGSTCSLPVPVGLPSDATVLRAARGSGMGVVELRVTLHAAARASVTFTVA